jgi:hypothetical protein
MAGVAIHAVVNVVPDAAVFGIHSWFVVRVTVSAAEHSEVTRIRMTVGARGPLTVVGARIDREPRVVEHCSSPRGCVVACLACCWEICGYVIRVRYRRELGLVTGIAVSWCPGVLSVHVAVCTSHIDVRARQWEGRFVVVEVSRRPCGCAVTYLASLRETGGDVVRVLRVVVIGQVAR